MISPNADPTFDATTGAYVLDCDWNEVDDPAVVVVEAVASVLERDSLELEPLQHVLDVDGLESLLTGHAVDDFAIEFEYAGTTVELDGGGLEIEPLDE